ncbi:MAG: 16S rRNA (guanine(966)-N(2))-methyltransferase RsmD [Betaproteobacteria bacterium]|nr:16S rRNA (guanine(966)-N(2))-methyltransferase RsmD [Betaproteobacteria bacterium]
MKSGKGRIRIIGGNYRRRLLEVAARPDLRPTPDRVRETLFNWLGQELGGLRCLDLYAGSGALGFEAASRGAARVVMVENDRVALAALKRSRAALGAAQVEIVRGDAEAWFARSGEVFDVVFLDPPFRQNAVPALLQKLAPRLEARARVYAESAAPVEVQAPWRELRRARAGKVSCQLLEFGAAQAPQGSKT